MKYNNKIFETKLRADRVSFLLEVYEKKNLLDEATDSVELDEFIDIYQWDDGFEVPFFIMQHRNCELGTALKMFYLIDGLGIFEEDFYDYFNEDWVAFVEILYNKILNEEFKWNHIKFKIPLEDIDKKELKAAHNIMDIFITDIG